jgi:hypothetical protein
MDWMKQHSAVIQCQEKVVVLTTPKGDRMSVEVAVQAPPMATMNQLNNEANQPECVVDDFPDVFPDTCQVCHPIATLSLLLIYYLELHP